MHLRGLLIGFAGATQFLACGACFYAGGKLYFDQNKIVADNSKVHVDENLKENILR